MDQAPTFVCRLQIHRLVSHVSLPSSLPRSPCPPRYKRHRASTSSQQRQPAAVAVAGSAPLRLHVKGCHGGAQAIYATLWSTEIVLFLPDLCLPQTGFNWFRSSHIKPRNAAWPQEHTGRGDNLTSKEHCHIFHGGKRIVCRFSEGFQEAHRVKRLISEQEEEAKGDSTSKHKNAGMYKAIQRDHSSSDLHLVWQNTQKTQCRGTNVAVTQTRMHLSARVPITCQPCSHAAQQTQYVHGHAYVGANVAYPGQISFPP